MSGSDRTDSLLKFVTYGTVVGISTTQGGDPRQPPCSTWGTAHHPHRCSRYSLLNNPHPPPTQRSLPLSWRWVDGYRVFLLYGILFYFQCQDWSLIDCWLLRSVIILKIIHTKKNVFKKFTRRVKSIDLND